MFSTILVVFMLLAVLGGVGFAPASPAFTPTHRGLIGTVVVALFVIWLLKYSAFAIH